MRVPPPSPRPTRDTAQHGLSLIELMVAMAIGLVVVLATTSLIVVSQTQERTTGGSNDMNQSSAYAATVLDQALRSAGAGFIQSGDITRAPGCLPHISREGESLLPRTTALPAPFAGLLGGATGTANLRVAPLLIGQGQSAGGSDIVMVMSGSAGIGDTLRPVKAIAPDASSLALSTAVALRRGDVLLLSGGSENENCAVVQVSNNFTFSAGSSSGEVVLGGAYHRDTVNGTNALSSLIANPGATGAEAFVSGLGNANSGNMSMQLFGVGTDRVLYRYDLLRQSGNDAAEAMAEGVVALLAVYSVDANIDNSGSSPSPTWTAPTGDYAIGTLLAKNSLDRARALRQIVGVRVSMLLRSSARQSTTAAAESYVMLDGLPGEQTVTLSDADRRFAHRLVETTIPLRSALMVQPADE